MSNKTGVKVDVKTPAMQWAVDQWTRDLEHLKRAQAMGRNQVGHTDPFTDEEFILNILRNARHFCDKHDLSFAEVDKKAHQAYREDLS